MKLSFAIIFICAFLANASIAPEMEGMEYETQINGTFLIGSPTFVYDRYAFAGGINSESELWRPNKIGTRLLFNRMSVTPSWAPLDASIWLKTGNELGDMIYQDFITDDRPGNRTPILEGGFKTPSFNGFWATARLFQDDHFSSAAYSMRNKLVSDEFSFFGENWPTFSSVYAGIGYTNKNINAHVLVGEEYLWVYSATSRWLPIHYKPRVETSVEINNLYVTLAYENAEYQNAIKKETGTRKEVNGAIRYKCDETCQKGMFQISAGIAFRAVDDSGYVYTELREDRIAFPFLELRIQPINNIFADITFGANERDWLLQDSVMLQLSLQKNIGTIFGVKNISGSRLNPLADTREFYDDKSVKLTADGAMNLVQIFAAVSDTLKNFGFGAKASTWAEYGAETFDTDSINSSDNQYITRYGNVSRIHSWIRGINGEFWVSAWYRKIFDFNATIGFEKLDGAISKAEVTPAEFYTGFTGEWLLNETFKISHSLRYRSNARWNLRTKDPLVIKGDWFLDASFEERIPKYGIYLTATLLHVLGDETIETINGGIDRLRFICSLKKTF